MPMRMQSSSKPRVSSWLASSQKIAACSSHISLSSSFVLDRVRRNNMTLQMDVLLFCWVQQVVRYVRDEFIHRSVRYVQCTFENATQRTWQRLPFYICNQEWGPGQQIEMFHGQTTRIWMKLFYLYLEFNSLLKTRSTRAPIQSYLTSQSTLSVIRLPA